jgi:hypothetical protein
MKKQMLFAVIFILAIMAAGCSKTKTTSLPSEVDQHLAWILQTVNGVAYCDMQSLRQSELGKAFEKDFGEKIAEMRKDRHFRKMLKQRFRF